MAQWWIIYLKKTQETQVLPLGWGDLLEKEMATHSSIFAWIVSWTKDPGGLQSMGPQRVGQDWRDWTDSSQLGQLNVTDITIVCRASFIVEPLFKFSFSSWSVISPSLLSFFLSCWPFFFIHPNWFMICFLSLLKLLEKDSFSILFTIVSSSSIIVFGT